MTDNVEQHRGHAAAHEKFPYLAHSGAARAVSAPSLCIYTFVRVRARSLCNLWIHYLAKSGLACRSLLLLQGSEMERETRWSDFAVLEKSFAAASLFRPSLIWPGFFFEPGFFVSWGERELITFVCVNKNRLQIWVDMFFSLKRKSFLRSGWQDEKLCLLLVFGQATRKYEKYKFYLNSSKTKNSQSKPKHFFLK